MTHYLYRDRWVHGIVLLVHGIRYFALQNRASRQAMHAPWNTVFSELYLRPSRDSCTCHSSGETDSTRFVSRQCRLGQANNRRQRWSELILLEKIKINRCVKPCGFSKPTSVQIQSFSDASETGLGQVSYLRPMTDSDQVHVSLLIAKARLAPLKVMSIPRLELTAAVISSHLQSSLLC